MKLNKLVVFTLASILILPIVVLADQGLLKVEVEDCSTGSDIRSARVEIQDDPEYTDSDGQAYFLLDEGTYTVEASKSGYTTKTTRATVRDDEITVKEICLNKDRVDCNFYVDIDVDVEGNDAIADIKISNKGDEGEWVSVKAWVCDSDYTDCRIMRCEDRIDPRVWVSADRTSRLTCEKEVRVEDDYRVKVSYTVCGRTKIKYSSSFEVPLDCNKEYLDVFGCFGNYRRQLYQFSDCSTEWRNVEHCRYGCESGYCLPRTYARLGNPIVILDREYEATACEVSVFSFDVKNIGERGDFDIEVNGEASDWIHVPEKITLNRDEKRTMIGYISLPCDIEGKYQFTITASDGKSDYDVGKINAVKAKEAGVSVGVIALGIILGIVAVLIIVFIYKLLCWLRAPKPKEEIF
jgi:hypothetical protein